MIRKATKQQGLVRRLVDFTGLRTRSSRATLLTLPFLPFLTDLVSGVVKTAVLLVSLVHVDVRAVVHVGCVALGCTE